jgi:hypothetical protein
MDLLAQPHEDAAMIGILLDDAEAEKAGIAILRARDVGDAKDDMAQPLRNDHARSPHLLRFGGDASCRPVVRVGHYNLA